MSSNFSEQNISNTRKILKRLPSATAASLGFGFFLLSLEALRLPAVSTVSSTIEQDSLSTIIDCASLIAALIAVLLLWRFGNKLSNTNAFALSLGALESIALYCSWDQVFIFSGTPIVEMSSDILRVLYSLLFFLWVKELFQWGMFTTAVVYVFAIITASGCSTLTAFMQPAAAAGALALLPFISSVCLCYCHKAARRMAKASSALMDSQNSADTIDNSPILTSSHARKIFVSAMSVSMFCYAVIFGYIHLSWVGFQDGGLLSLFMQLGISAGSALMGIFLWVLINRYWSPFNINLYVFGIVPITILALWLTSLIHESSIVSYLILLNFAQKSVYFFMIAIPFYVKRGKEACGIWLILFMSFEVGKVVSGILRSIGPDPSVMYGTVSTLLVVILFVCCSAMILAGMNKDSMPTFGQKAGAAVDREHKNETLSENEQAALDALEALNALPNARGNLFRDACKNLAETHHLTERELDAFYLLARGRTATFIAESLVISPATAKVYVRNIYTKLGVHSQQDLISMVEDDIERQRELYKK